MIVGVLNVLKGYDMQRKTLKILGFMLIACMIVLAGCNSDATSDVNVAPVVSDEIDTMEDLAVDAEVTDVEDVDEAVSAETDQPAPTPTPAPPLRPIVAASEISDPGAQLGEYMAEGLFISHFEADDIAAWQGYSQDTETTISSSETPPDGYISSSNWHAKQTDKWVMPTDGFVLEESDVIFGDSAGRWSDTTESTRISNADIPHDWSDYMFLSFWAHSAEANDVGMELAVYSELDSTSDDDYYKKEIIIDWEGWRLFEIPLHEFSATREPVGWDKVDYLKIASSGWGHEPNPSTELIFDEMKLSNVRIGPKLAIDMPTDMVHPYLLLNSAEIADIQTKILQYDWAKEAYGYLKARADNWLDQTITVPETGGGFYHDDDDAAYAITERHYELADGARDLALMYQFTGDAAYAQKAKEIMLAYADTYLTYDIQDSDGRTGDQASAGGRATSQGINEARWAIPLAWAYDLLFNELSADEQTAIADGILHPVAQLLMLNNEGRHNHQTWYNAGVGVIGFALGDKEYVWYSLLKDDSSLGYQLDKSVTADGMWYEGSMHYQFYVLRALMPLMEATHRAGFNIYENPQYKALFDFMVTYADPTLQMPTINDGRVVDLTDSDRATYYELAYNRLRDPRYVPILAQSNRTDLNALLYGVGEIGDSAETAWQSQYYDDSDLAVLRSGADEDSIQATLNFMGYQGGHSHADQLSLVLYGLGMPLAPDAGSIKYRLPEQEAYFKQTLAHNGLVVDGASQERANSGVVTQFAASTPVQMVRVVSEDVYPDVRLQRTILLNGDYLIDIYDVASDNPHTYDWVYHNVGEFSTEDVDFQSAETSIGESGGYEYLQGVQSAETDTDWQGQWQVAPGKQVRINVLGEPDTTYFSAEGPIAARVGDEMAEELLPVLISRREMTGTQFVSIIQPYSDDKGAITISPLSLTDEAGQAITQDGMRSLQIDRADAIDLLILDNKLSVKQTDDIVFNGTWAWTSIVDGMPHWLIMNGSSLSGDGWTVTQEDLSSDKTPDGMGMLFEMSEPGRYQVQNTYGFVTYVILEGLMDSAVSITEYDRDGNMIRDMPPKTNENGVVKFLAHPGVIYEIVGQ